METQTVHLMIGVNVASIMLILFSLLKASFWAGQMKSEFCAVKKMLGDEIDERKALALRVEHVEQRCAARHGEEKRYKEGLEFS